ncbi:hypothetical protein [Actinomadura violacea]|uniref:Secreted protein n=1 Tax=Actinomadura violacea TaxID=2819934 RepID=A0ABS3RLW1_9ACTN|nr:hypothetical protein [Actinomadura violacea]MBO2457722.1 hypothetical protein [Actinomadura violacea]
MSVALAARAVPRRWSTPRWLWTVLAAAVGLAVLSWLAATAVLVGSRSAVSSVKDGGAPAYVSARTAHAALSDADRAAWQSFRSGAAQLIGPGQQFRDDLTTASDNLAHLAELDFGGATGRDLLRAVNAQVVTYQGLVEQADATYREGLEKLGYAYLSYASDLLRGDGGLLSRIDEIARRDLHGIDGERDSAWAGRGLALGTAVIGAVLLAVLGYAQVSMARRFRRLVNLPLVAASAVLVGLVVWTSTTFLHIDHAFADASNAGVPAFDRTMRTQIRGADVGAGKLRAGHNVPQAGGLDVAAADKAQRPLEAKLADATDTRGLDVGLPLLSLAIAGLAALGLWIRLREYRR